jgi:glucose-6-phosphate 1-dehydrogenase
MGTGNRAALGPVGATYGSGLVDFLRGDPTLFVRVDEVDAAWQYIDGIHAGWRAVNQRPQKYLAGSWGPTSAIALAERHGHSWYE